MNLLLIIVGVIFMISAIIGYRKGFIGIAASLAATILTIVIVVALAPIMSRLLLNTFPIQNMIREKCVEIFMEDKEVVSEGQQGASETSKDVQIEIIENSELPDVLQQLLLENNNKEMYEGLGVNTFFDYISGYLASLIANVISFVVLFIIVSLLMRLLIKAMKLLNKLPLVGMLNRLAGAALGLVNGLLIVWVLYLVVMVLYGTELGQICYQNIMSSQFLKFIFEHNVMMNYVTKFIG